jgi:fatty acid desaturase
LPPCGHNQATYILAQFAAQDLLIHRDAVESGLLQHRAHVPDPNAHPAAGRIVAYPGLSLGLLRAFTEHRAAADSQERTASVESNVVFGLMYLYNNLHVAHHLKPAMPWYDIPRFYRENRSDLLERNGQFTYRGYAQLARRYFFVPVFSPVFPDETSRSSLSR